MSIAIPMGMYAYQISAPSYSRLALKSRLIDTVLNALRFCKKTDVLYPLDSDLAEKITDALDRANVYVAKLTQDRIEGIICNELYHFHAPYRGLYPSDREAAVVIAWWVFQDLADRPSLWQWLVFRKTLLVTRYGA